MYAMKVEGMYGVATVPSDVFERLNPAFFISQTTESVVYMCANEAETRHLLSLGIDITADIWCDWYKILKGN